MLKTGIKPFNRNTTMLKTGIPPCLKQEYTHLNRNTTMLKTGIQPFKQEYNHKKAALI
jgi:hypothetical protein